MAYVICLVLGTIVRKLAIALDDAGSNLPSEFRLFVPGWNETENGNFLFDADAAAKTIAAYKAWGVELAIDLEHQMLEAGPQPDPTARDARGWCKLELRADGSLWAVDVKWTPDGRARLTEKRQRYVSPAFEVDPETKRVTKIINVAITAIPATHQTPALVAASARGQMDPNKVKEALEALIEGDAEKCAELLKDMIAAAAGGEETPAEAPAPAAEEAAAVPAEEPQPADADEDEEKKAAVAVTSSIVRLTGKASAPEALEEIEVWKASHLKLEAETKKLAEERAALEASERRRLCVELVTLGAEFPSTVWADDKATSLKSRWADMKIETLREHVADQKAARAGKRAPNPPKSASPGEGSKVFETAHGPVTLSASELRSCEQTKADPKVYAANKARIAAAKRGA